MHKSITFGVVEHFHELQAIQDLQQANLPEALSEEEALAQGFVTIRHELSLLEEMNRPFPHIVARMDDQVIGYTLVMLRSFSERIPLLIPMFREIDSTVYRGKLLEGSRYLVMGQVCIAKGFRGQGIFTGLYAEMKRRLCDHFEYIITEVSERNQRSMRAHEKVGFKHIKAYNADGEHWVILLLETK